MTKPQDSVGTAGLDKLPHGYSISNDGFPWPTIRNPAGKGIGSIKGEEAKTFAAAMNATQAEAPLREARAACERVNNCPKKDKGDHNPQCPMHDILRPVPAATPAPIQSDGEPRREYVGVCPKCCEGIPVGQPCLTSEHSEILSCMACEHKPTPWEAQPLASDEAEQEAKRNAAPYIPPVSPSPNDVVLASHIAKRYGCICDIADLPSELMAHRQAHTASLVEALGGWIKDAYKVDGRHTVVFFKDNILPKLERIRDAALAKHKGA